MQVSFMDAPSTASVSDGTSTHTGWHIRTEGTRKVVHIYSISKPVGSGIQTLSEDIFFFLLDVTLFGRSRFDEQAHLRGNDCAEK